MATLLGGRYGVVGVLNVLVWVFLGQIKMFTINTQHNEMCQ